MDCTLCGAALGTSSVRMLRRLLDAHVRQVHGIGAGEALRAVEPKAIRGHPPWDRRIPLAVAMEPQTIRRG